MRSSLTGFVHDETGFRISIFENFAYALYLFKTRQKEKIEEGILLIDKCLDFEVEGNFPIYLHEYPHAFNPHMPEKVLLVMTQIVKGFSHVIVRRDQYVALIERLFSKAKEGVLLDLLKAFWLKEVCALPCIRDFQDGHYLPYISLVTKSDPVIDQAYSLYHPKHGYLGPLDSMRGLDYFKLAFSETDSFYRALFLQSFTPNKIPFQSTDWVRFSNEIGEGVYKKEGSEGELYRFHLGQHIFSYFAHAPSHLSQNEMTIQTSRPLYFYISASNKITIKVDGDKASVFGKNDTLQLITKDGSIFLQFDSDEAFMGHISKGNRAKENDPYLAQDYLFTLRPIHEKISSVSVGLRYLLQDPSHEDRCLHKASCP